MMQRERQTALPIAGDHHAVAEQAQQPFTMTDSAAVIFTPSCEISTSFVRVAP